MRYPSLNFRVGLADMPDCARCGSGSEETAEHAFYYSKRFRPFWNHIEEWTARIEPKQLILLDVGFGWEACGVSRGPSCSSNGNLDDAKVGIVWRCKLFRVKIRCNRKRLDNIRQKLGECSEPGSKKGDNAGVILLSSSYPWRLRYGSFGTPSRVSKKRFHPSSSLVSSMLWVIVPVT